MTLLTPLVSVCCITYNQEKFIREAVDSFLMQQTNFPIEVIIHDDASTDNTTKIVREYQEKYPHIIKLILQTENQYSLRRFGFLSDLFNSAKGKYIALCEGDDYWTDPLKLQKQVDFLEANPDFAICFHNTEIINEDYIERNRLNNDNLTPEISTLDNLLEGSNYIATCSVVIKTDLIQNLPNWFNSVFFGDYALWIIASRYGKIKYINEIMSVYRIHQGGVHGYLSNSDKGITIASQRHYEFWRLISKSGIINKSNLNQATLRAIHNVIHCATKSQDLRTFIKYHYLLLRHSRGKKWRFVIGNLIRVCQKTWTRILFKLG
ncbi:glycosyltransferase [Dolichospermum circinale]|uniref:glycosyltransferase n=1 Tax=Dolichospermum circinale TaxID=109265 RepID=UPI0004073BC2|nr:glycosyltransferase [Dolichospermum circinale]